MPSTSPGHAAADKASQFEQINPGAPSASLHGLASFTFRQKRYVAYISGRKLAVLAGPTQWIQTIGFQGDLVAVSAEDATGRLCVAEAEAVHVLAPMTEGWKKTWWEKQLCLRRAADGDDEARCLSWGNDGEMLVGGSRQLNLFSTLPSSRTASPSVSPVDGQDGEDRAPLWSRSVASPVAYAAFSPSASLIASCGQYDRLVKIWRRLSFEEGLFDRVYLPHSGTVTHLEWRPPSKHLAERRGSSISGRHDEDAEVLYTFASDGVLRIWRTAGLHDLDILTLHTTLDLVSAIPESPTLGANGWSSSSRPSRHAFILPSDDFSLSIASALGASPTRKLSHSLEHLKELSSRSPDVIVVFDEHGRMSAWGVHSIGHKRRPEGDEISTDPFHIAHAEGLPLAIAASLNTRTKSFFDEQTLNILMHTFDGHVRWWHSSVEKFFSPSGVGAEMLTYATDWSGHQANVVGLRQTGRGLLTWTNQEDVARWVEDGVEHQLSRTCVVANAVRVLDAMSDDVSGLIITLHDHHMSLWDESGTCVDQQPHNLSRGQFRFCSGGNAGASVVYDNSGRGALFKVTRSTGDSDGKVAHHLDVAPATMLLPSGTRHTFVSSSANDPAMVIAVSIDASGHMEVVAARLPEGQVALSRIPKLKSSTFETGVDKADSLEANTDVAVITSASRTILTIVDLRDGYIEYSEAVTEEIRHLSLKRSDSESALLAVAYDKSVEVLVQGRHRHASSSSSWTRLRRVTMPGQGHRIEGLEWLASGSLALAGGNGFVSCARYMDGADLADEVRSVVDVTSKQAARVDALEVAHKLRRPLPMWHPSFLAQLPRHGRFTVAVTVLSALLEKLKFWSEGEHIDPHLDLELDALFDASSGQRYHVGLGADFVRDLVAQIDEKQLPTLSTAEQARLRLVIYAVAYVMEQGTGLDSCAMQYLFEWKLQLLQIADDPAATAVDTDSADSETSEHGKAQGVPKMQWREIAFAHRSTTQQPLLDILTLHYDNKLTWPIARALGITAWLSDREALESVFESLAQAAYRETSPPDPINASLFFLALRKKATLLGLWRIATWHKEQRATTNFLKRDFNQVDARTAAKKNAYALMGKRRFHYAAAFFLLADDADSATSLLAGQCEDTVLAVAVARLFGGAGSQALTKLVEDRLLPQTKINGDKWMASWCHAILSRPMEAASALVRPQEGVKTWAREDPSALTLYGQLRKHKGSGHEYDAVLRAARVLERMGLSFLALETVSEWEFVQSGAAAPSGVHAGTEEASSTEADAQSAVPGTGVDESAESPVTDSVTEPATGASDAITSPSVAAPIDEKAARAAKAAELMAKMKAKKQAVSSTDEKKKPEPTQFKEPDANSLLDSFGL